MKTMYQKFLLLLLMVPFGLWAQTKTVNGTVRDNTTGEPLPGVNVLVEGTQNGTSSDMDGKYTLPNVAVGSRITFTFIGFANQTLTFTGQTSLDVILSEDATQLSEVVVIGYGTAKKKDATSAITTVNSENFQKGPIVGAEQLIQGRAAGVQVTTGGGEPGGGSLVRIRSGSSLTGNNDPLYVIDGVPIEVGGGGSIGGRNPLASINQNDIESMTILKDAAATAIYGSRASNGVVIITTKKGKSGEMKISYNGNFQVYEVGDVVDVLSADSYRNFVNNNPNATDAQKALLGTANTNWQKEIYRTATGTDHNVALQGGTEELTYRASVGYTNMNGVLKTDNFERTTTGVNLIGNFFDRHLKVEVNNKTSVMQNIYADKGAIGNAVSFDPTQPVRRADGSYFQWLQSGGNFETNASRNPVAMLNQKHNYGTSFRSLGNAQFEYKIHGWEDMKLVANFGYDYSSGRTYGDNAIDYGVTNEAGDTYESKQDKYIQVMDLYFNYVKYLESIKTNIDFTAGYNYNNFKYVGSSTNFDYENSLTTFTNPYQDVLNLQSFFGRATFTIADKYILNGSFRTDGSSRFSKNNRWGYFPSASAAWKIKEESFLKESEVVSDLKLRASWGITGQQDTGILYPSAPLYGLSTPTANYQMGYDAQGNPIFVTTASPLAYNPNLVWEETTTINFGVEFGFFDDRVTGSAEYYQRKTNDLIIFSPNPQGVNFSNRANYNIGTMENKGVELSLDVYPVRNDKVTWRVGGNFTWQDSEITKMNSQGVIGPGIYTGGISGGVGTEIQNHQVGFWPASYYVYEQAYNSNGQPLEGVYVDRNEDGLINEKDLYRANKAAANIFYGINTDLTIGNWWISTSLRGSWGNYNYNNVFSNTGNGVTGLPSNGPYLNNLHSNALTTGFHQPQYRSDYYVQNAEFFRMDNATIGYNFKNVFSEGSNMRITGAVQNVFVITPYKGIDPEISGGIDNNFYPRPRIYTLGLNVNF